MRNFFHDYLPPGVLVGGLILGLVLAGLAIAVVLWIRPGAQVSPVSTANLAILPAPTYTLPLPTALPTPLPTDTPAVPPTPPPAQVQVGQLVQINGTGVDGLRLRASPGLQAKILFVAIEAEVFEVRDGPREVDGYVWWYLASPYQQDYEGWAVANYLALTQQNP
jgi:hypothetical protein